MSAAKKRIQRVDVTRKFWVDLTDDEKKRLGKEAGELNRQLAEERDKFDGVKNAHKSKTKALNNDLTYKLGLLDKGKELRELKVIEVRDYTDGEIRWMDGDKQIDKREMRDDEKQVPLAAKEETVKDDTATAKAKLDQEVAEFKKRKAAKAKTAEARA